VFLMLAVTLMWSTAGVVTRHLEVAKSFEITFWRAFFTALALSVILPAIQGRGVFLKIRHASTSFWVSGVCWAVMFTAFMVALTLASVANVLVTMAISPLLTAIVARVFIGHRIALRTWVAIGVAGTGIVVMNVTQMSQTSLLGTLAALLVPIASAINWTVTQHAHAQGHDVDMVPAVWVGAVLSALATFALAFPWSASAHDVGLLALLGVGQLAIPCALSVACARVLKAPEMSLLALLEVPFGILLAWAGAGEAPAIAVLAGAALVIGAMVANELMGWRQRA
jgi:drug/metabolite transporter (DMT)-like permease